MLLQKRQWVQLRCNAVAKEKLKTVAVCLFLSVMFALNTSF